MLTRETVQKSLIEKSLKEAGRPVSASELLEICQKEIPKLGIATIHRTLKNLKEQGVLEKVEIADEAVRFCFARGHHHHFKCNKCNKIYDIEGCSSSIGKLPDGFKESRHEVTIYGICADC